MLRSAFYNHGHFCAGRSVEVIVWTTIISLLLLSYGLFSQSDRICGWNYDCGEMVSPSGSDVIIFSIIKCSAILYTYLQFRNLRRRETKYMIGISGLLSVLPSFIFSIVIIKTFGNDISGVKEVLPFFLLLVDLSKACELADFALTSNSQEEVIHNIARGVEAIGPAMTLDSIAEILVIGVGTLSDVSHLEYTCYYGCLAVFANYLVFMVLYPACLALFLEVVRKHGRGVAFKQFQRLAKLVREEDKNSHTNPVTQNIKIIMSTGLFMVHVYSRLIAEKKTGLGEILAGKSIVNQHYREPDISLWHFYLQRFFTVRADSTFTAVLAVFLVIKYLMFDEDYSPRDGHKISESEREASMEITSVPSRAVSFVTSAEEISNSTGLRKRLVTARSEITEVNSEEDHLREKLFTLGSDSDDDSITQDIITESVSTQTDDQSHHFSPLIRLPKVTGARTLDECIKILNSEEGPGSLTDEEIIKLMKSKHIPQYKLESMLGDYERSIAIRRKNLSASFKETTALDNLPFENYSSYDMVTGACCENVIGYLPVPVGVAGPLLLDGRTYQVPLATTEGCLVASTNRGCRVLQQSGGVHSVVIGDGMSRAPAVRLPSAEIASEVKLWLEIPENFCKVKEAFDDTSRFARLTSVQTKQAGRLLYIRFVAKTGDAMGMNMLSKGSEAALKAIKCEFSDLDVLSLSGNMCTDKKPSAVNWIEGRGKSVVCEAIIPGHVVKNVLRTSVSEMVQLNTSKNMIGSALAGSIGGFNAHAANLVTAIFIATGQDPAQNVTSSNCITMMEATGENNADLCVSCTMPSIEVGTVGGGTILPPQAACLKMLGIQGSSEDEPGDNAKSLARIVCATVLAGELSLMGALAAGHLVRSHMKHNRSSINMNVSKDTNESSSNLQSSESETPSDSSDKNNIPCHRPAESSKCESSHRDSDKFNLQHSNCEKSCLQHSNSKISLSAANTNPS